VVDVAERESSGPIKDFVQGILVTMERSFIRAGSILNIQFSQNMVDL